MSRFLKLIGNFLVCIGVFAFLMGILHLISNFPLFFNPNYEPNFLFFFKGKGPIDSTKIFPLLFLLPFLFSAGLRILIMITEFIFLKPLLISSHANKDLLKMNAYAMFALTLVLTLPTWVLGTMAAFGLNMLIFLAATTVIAVVVGLCEVYMKIDFIREHHAKAPLEAIKKLLSYIIIPMYMLYLPMILVVVKILEYFSA